ncbi:relaxase/mobilization nuclease domain-containing protein [Ructibacterium gallinarum]|uniref:Relaxase/mobilization nuclease domain-containing protein n=1 Tax=Ructibacterium gallinarum TaxID=2779355 RepID=A0A9D5M7A9_9FIRM|nr:relaxase/mobilization nuclease domain-containing protein [Ructibacterium gallinarum]MBE5040862.1 relaxase/mobilization nuclease domain-containing protein [Ructibacterium gallinarum]
MAYTKNHTINATLKKAIDYICNPEKTDGALLIHSYGSETADMEFDWTREKSTSPTPHLARHLIQAFSPGETTPEQAHEIGKRLADEVLGGKFEYVLTTHIDRSHIHNHIIFNDVSFVDYKHSHVNRRWNNQTRRISDNLCREYGLSVIPPNENKGKSYVEYSAEKKGTSWKAQLKADIDKAISRSTDFEDFLLRMEIADYEVKRGKYISFRAKGKERFTRGKTLGSRYTEESIRDRIERRTRAPRKENRRINLLIDIQNNIKAQESKGYEHWAKLYNLKQASRTLNFLTDHNISTYEELEQAAGKIHADFAAVSEQIKGTEQQMSDTTLLMKHTAIYDELKPVYSKYRKAKDKATFAKRHRRELTLFESAAKKLKGRRTQPFDELRQAADGLAQQKKELYGEYKKLKQQAAEMDVIRRNVEQLLNLSKENEKDREPEL